MRTLRRFVADRKGFTLIEVILALVIAVILGAMMITVLGTGVTQSATPVNWLRTNFDIYEVMENITADYRQKLMTDNPFTLSSFMSDVQSNYNSPDYSVTFKYVSFDAGHVENAAACSGSDCRVLKITITQGLHNVYALFSE